MKVLLFALFLFLIVGIFAQEQEEKKELNEQNIKDMINVLQDAAKSPEIKLEDFQKLAKAFQETFTGKAEIPIEQQILYGMMGDFFKEKADVSL